MVVATIVELIGMVIAIVRAVLPTGIATTESSSTDKHYNDESCK